MNIKTKVKPNSHHAAILLLSAVTLAAISMLAGCNGAGQSQVTQGDRPAEGEGWAVQEQMADQQGR